MSGFQQRIPVAICVVFLVLAMLAAVSSVVALGQVPVTLSFACVCETHCVAGDCWDGHGML